MFGKLKSGNSKISRRSTSKIQSMNDTAPEVPANEQQQNRIVLYFSNNQKISAVPDGEVTATPAQRKEILAKLRSGEISWAELEGFLRNVAMPLVDTKEAIDKVFTQIVQDLRQKQILAVLTGYNATDWQMVSRGDLKNLLGKPLKGQPNYRTPVGFATFRQKFLSGIEDKADAEQMREYEQAMDDLERKIYGRRFDYYQQVRLMKNGKAANGSAVTSGSVAADGSVAANGENKGVKPEEVVSAGDAEEAKPEGVTKKPPVVMTGSAMLNQEQSTEILSRAVVMGDPWKQGGNEYVLSSGNLLGNGLVPVFGVQMDGRTIALSQPFQLSDGRGAALGFVPTNEGEKVRGFYLDPRTGMWQFAPDIIRGPRAEGMAQVTEGYGGVSTVLPVVLQRTLTDLVKTHGFREITTVNPDFLFAGTAVAYDTMQEYREALGRGQMRSDFYREVDRQPAVINAQSGDKSKAMPQLLSVNANVAPNFEQFEGHFVTYSMLAGQVQIDIFKSYDGLMTWLFCSDEYGRTWIGEIEVNSPLTSTGCRKNWVEAGDLMTPLYEYSTQAGGQGDPNDVRKGMVGMWNTYLSKIPLIQEYIGWKNRTR